jgi:hypothetical protein
VDNHLKEDERNGKREEEGKRRNLEEERGRKGLISPGGFSSFVNDVSF